MKGGLRFLIELIPVLATAGYLGYISVPKMAVGALLTFLGAFYPSMKDARQSKEGTGQLSWKQITIKFSGGIRFLVVIAGMIVLVGATFEGYSNLEGNNRAQEAKHRASLERYFTDRGVPVDEQ